MEECWMLDGWENRLSRKKGQGPQKKECKIEDGEGGSKASTTVLKISSVLAGVILETRSLVFHFLAT